MVTACLDHVDPVVLAVISMVVTVILSLSIYLRWRLGGITAPTIQACVATVWCGYDCSSRPDAIRQTFLLCFRTAVVAWMLYRLTHFFEEPTISGVPVTLDWKLSYFTVCALLSLLTASP
jgi:peptidoglycan biosynthesis protein MviN/MurJ (putative lipid II flippase)